MHWTIAAPFINKINQKDEHWLAPYVKTDKHQFDIIPRREPLQNWHERKSAVTGVKDWLVYWQQGADAIKATQGGVITVFPQLPAVVGMQRRITRKRFPIVAWLFNVGTCSTGLRQTLAQASLDEIDRFIVHTRHECEIYHKWLGIPKERFEFIHFHEKEIPVTHTENTAEPFVTALGSAHRDFPRFFEAVSKLNLPTVVASGKRALEGLTIPPNVQTPLGISKAECLRLAQEARINVIPLLPNPNVTAAGQVTIVEAMQMGRAVIATKCHGVEDYIEHGVTGWLVEPESVEDLTHAIDTLWNDAELRNRLGKAAKQYAKENFSYEAAGVSLVRILDEVAQEYKF